MLWQALEAVRILEKEGIDCELINIHTIKPLDLQAIIQSASKTKKVVSCEEHQRNGGLGDSIAQVLVQHCPCRQEYVAVNDSFGESGRPLELLDKYGLSVQDVVKAVKKLM
jgi:transketolase